MFTPPIELHNMALAATEEREKLDKQRKDRKAKGMKRYRENEKRKRDGVEKENRRLREEVKEREEELEKIKKEKGEELEKLTKESAEVVEELSKDAQMWEQKYKDQVGRDEKNWPRHDGKRSMQSSTFVRTVPGQPNAIERLFKGPAIDPSTSHFKSPPEDRAFSPNRFHDLQEQVMHSLNYYLSFENAEAHWAADDDDEKALQYISGSRWDFILGVKLKESKNYLLGYLLQPYKK
jgi:flagellar biosynthesis GTPase FlhF